MWVLSVTASVIFTSASLNNSCAWSKTPFAFLFYFLVHAFILKHMHHRCLSQPQIFLNLHLLKTPVIQVLWRQNLGIV